MDGESAEDREKRLQRLWAQLDKKNTGSLDLAKLKQGLIQMNHPLKDADAMLSDMLKTCDINRDGKITYQEFRRFCDETEKQLWELFQTIDRDHNGNLDKSELSQAFEKAGVAVSNIRLDKFFGYIDKNHDGTIDFAEWRDFLLFLPHDNPGLKAIFSYYDAAVKLTAEGDVHVSHEALSGLGYFVAGGLSGITSRTTTAPLDRLKVYLIAQTGTANEAVKAAKSGNAIQAAKHGTRTLVHACKELWAAGGIRSLFAGNGLNVLKVVPESGVKFGAFEASKQIVAKLEGHNDPKRIGGWALFTCGGTAGMVSQAVVYPLDTLKFRTQCETVPGATKTGNALVLETARKMWRQGGVASYYRGLPMGLIGMFPYAAIDLFLFERLKRRVVKRNMRLQGLKHEEDALPGNFSLAFIGGFSGAVGASAVYPINLLRTRLQSQGTTSHPRTYNGVVDVARQTYRGEGVRGLFKGLVPNLLKVVPAVSITYVVYENTKRALKLP